MQIDHFSIYRWGTANITWTGTREELAYLKAWVKRVVPSVHYGWGPPTGVRTKAGLAFDRTHLSGSFDVTAWTLMCYHWTNTSAPAIGQVWVEKDKNYPYETAHSFGENADIIDHDLGALSIARATLQKSPRKKRTPEVTDAIAYLAVQEQTLRDAKTNPEGYALKLKQRPKPTPAEKAREREKRENTRQALKKMKEFCKRAKAGTL